MEKLRVEADQHHNRAEKAEAQVKELKDELSRKENDVQGLNNKITLLQENLERTEKRVEEVSNQSFSHFHIQFHSKLPFV